MRNRTFSRTAILLSCATAVCAQALSTTVFATTTYTTVTANWNGGTSGDWINAADWSTNPVAPDNGTPANTVYDATIGSGANVTIGGGESVNVDNVSTAGYLGIMGTLNLAQPDNANSSGLLTGIVHLLSSGALQSGTLENAEISAPVSSGAYNIYMQNGTLQNVTLGSDLTAGNLGRFTAMNSAANPQGLNLNGHAFNFDGVVGSTVTFADATTAAGADVGELLSNGTINVLQAGYIFDALHTLNIGTGAVLNFLPQVNSASSPSYLTGNTINNAGSIVVGPGNASQLQNYTPQSYAPATLIINPTNFTNQSAGHITVYSGGALLIDSSNFINDGVIQTSNAVGLTASGGASITIAGTWTNNGTVNIGSSDFLIDAASPSGTGSVGNSGGQVVTATNASAMNIGSSSVTGVFAEIDTPTFSNAGTITVYNGNVLQFGQLPSFASVAEPSITWSNSGTIQTDNANFAGIGEFPSTATMYFYGNWSNTGTIAAGPGNTVELGGVFHPSDVGLASSGSNAVFHGNGATVNLTGTIVNTNNNLIFSAASGVWTGQGGKIENGLLEVQNDANGTPYLQGNYIMENVSLGADLTVTGNLDVESSANGVAGLVANGHAIELKTGDITFNGSSPGSPLTYDFGGVINMYSPDSNIFDRSASVTFTSSAVINVLTAAGTYFYNDIGINGNNYGDINVGSPTISGAEASIGMAQNYGLITAYSGDTANYYGSPTSPIINGAFRVLVGGTINLTGNAKPITAELASGSTLEIQLGSAGKSGLVSVDGNLKLDSGSILSLSQLVGSTFTTPYDIINYSGTLTGTFTSITPGYLLDYSHTGEILVTAVPEPATLALLALGFAGLMLTQRKIAKRTTAA